MADPVALTALVVSLVALLATTGQLLQQYFATADGFRRCQPSVMGLWAKRTKLRFRWREFRFETIFCIPRIVYGPVHREMGKNTETAGGNCSLIDTPESLKASMTFPGWNSYDARKYYNSDELVCWVPLLAQLHIQGREAVKYFPQKPGAVENDTMIPSIQIIHKSWDFMPPDVVRPMASSTVTDIAIMARRLGMVWKTFDPGSGSMRAEGNGHVITSTMVRSLGTVLQYSFTSRENAGNCSYIPVWEADMLGFGLVEFDHRLFGSGMPRALDVGSYQGIASTVSLLTAGVLTRGDLRDSSPVGIEVPLKQISRAMKSESDFIPGLNDLVPLCSAMLSTSPSNRKDRWRNRIPAPNLYLKGVTSSTEGFRVFERRLQDLVSERSDRATHQSRNVLACLKGLREKFHHYWEHEEGWEQGDFGFWGNEDNELAIKSMVMQYHADMIVFQQGSRVPYRYLVGEHILMAINSIPDANANSNLLHRYGLNVSSRPDLAWSMHTYFEELQSLMQKMIQKCSIWRPELRLNVEEVEDAWFSMMFRAFCWQRSHTMIPGIPPIPSEYWNSKMPVYIG